MTVAYDAFSSIAQGTGDRNWNHTPVGTPRGVIVFVLLGTNSLGADAVVGVTYGGSAMTEVSGSPVVKTTTEAMQVHCFVLLSSIPTGVQAVAVDVNAGLSEPWQAGAITVTAGADTEVIDSDGTINSSTSTDPSVTLSLGGRTCFCAIGFSSGQNAVTGITPLTGWTSRLEDDFGGQTDAVYTYDTVSTADVTAGWTQASEDAVAIAIAISEVAGGTTYNQSASGTVTPAGTVTKSTSTAKAGSITPAGALSKLANKVFAGTLSTSGSATKQTGKGITGTLPPTGSLNELTSKALVGVLTTAGTISKQASKVISGTVTTSGVITRLISKSLAGVLSLSGALAALSSAAGVVVYAIASVLSPARNAITRSPSKDIAATSPTKDVKIRTTG